MPDEIIRVIAEGESRGIDQVQNSIDGVERKAQSAGRALDELRAKIASQSAGTAPTEVSVEEFKALYGQSAMSGLGARGGVLSYQETAAAAQQFGAATAQASAQSAPMVRTLGELGQELSLAKKEFDGSPASVIRLSAASREYNEVLKQANDTMGKSGGAVQQLGSMFERQIMRIGIGIAVWSTLRVAQREIQETIKAMEQYSIAVGRFAAITDQTISAASQQYNALRNIVSRGGFTPTEAAPAIIEAGRMAKTPAAQQQLVAAGAGLAEFLGQKDPQKTLEAINSALLAMGQDASHAAQMADLIGAAYKRVGGSADDFLRAAADAAVISDKIGISFEKTMAIITGGATASGQSMGTVFQSLNRISEGMDKLPIEKMMTLSQGFEALGVHALDAQGNLRPVGEIIDELGRKFASLSSVQQEQAITLLFGGERVRGQAYAAAKGILESYSRGLADGFQDAAGTVQKGNALIDQQFGQVMNRLKARAEELKQQGDVFSSFRLEAFGNIDVFLGSMFGGAAGGARAARGLEARQMMGQYGLEGGTAAYKQQFIKSLTGMTPDQAKEAINEYNETIKQLFASISGIGTEQRFSLAAGAIIKPSDAENLISQAKQVGNKTGVALLDGILSGFSPSRLMSGITQSIQQATDRAASQAAQSAARFSFGTPQGRLGLEMYQYQQRLGTTQEAASPLANAQQIDLTKYSQQQIVQLKEMSVRLSLQELNALQAELQLLGLSSAEISKIVLQKQKELDSTVALIQTQQGMQYLMGQDIANIQKASQMWEAERQRAEKAKKAEEQPFAFQRLQNVTPEQFPQLQALTAYYNAMLTKLGSPEKQQPINLMLGEGQDSVFKVLTSRMTALQLALEDLNKTEKAQLAGTWNLPAGATALVPIQSLDIQRWNKQGGGSNLDVNALMALVAQMEAENAKAGKFAQNAGPTGAGISGAGGAYPPIDRVIREQPIILSPAAAAALVGGARTTPPYTPERRVVGEDKQLQMRIPSTREATQLMSLSSAITLLSGNVARMSNLGGGRFGLGGGGGRGTQEDRTGAMEAARPTGDRREIKNVVNVEVSALPLRATFNANLSIILNAAVVARAIFPILYREMLRISRGSGTGINYVGTVR